MYISLDDRIPDIIGVVLSSTLYFCFFFALLDDEEGREGGKPVAK